MRYVIVPCIRNLLMDKWYRRTVSKKTLPENSNFPAKLSCTFGKINKWPITFDGKYATLQVDIASDGTMSNAKFDPNPKPNIGGGNLNINFAE